MSELWTYEQGKLTLRPHKGQARVLRSRARFVAMLAGTQGGKTSMSPLLIHREMRRRGPGDYLAVTSTVPLLKLKMLSEFLTLFVHTLHLGTWRASDKVIECHDGSRIIFGSAANPESLESATAKGAVLDECGQDQFRLQAWEAILRRLSLHQGRAFLGTTLYNLGWLKQEIYDRWRDGDPNYEVVQFRSIDNPAFPQAEFERARATMPDWKFRMMYLGEYSRPAGMIYEDYRDEYRERGGHLVQPFALPPSWPRYVGIDFGAVNTATVWLAHDPAADVYYLYRESLEGNKTTPEHAKTQLQAAAGVNVISWHGGAKSEVQPRLDWRAAGIRVLEPPIPDVEAGIDRVTALFKGLRLFVFDNCRGVRDELGTYSREVDETGQTLEKIKDKETFHRLDALRYVVLGVSRQARAIRSYQG